MKTTLTLLFIALTVNTFSQSGLIAHYPMDGTASDISGNGNHATIYGGPSIVADEYGNLTGALYFDGINDYFLLPTIPFLVNNYTYSICVNATSIPSNNQVKSILSIGDNTADQYILLSNSASQNMYGFNCGSYFTPAVTPNRISVGVMPSTAIFYHLAVTRSNSTLSFYVNGSLINAIPISNPTPSYGSSPMAYLGRRTGSVAQYFIGSIEDVKIFNRELSQQEIQSLCALNAGVNENLSEHSFHCFPNPTEDVLNIKMDNLLIKELIIRDLLGKHIDIVLFNTSDANASVSVKHLKTGLYFVEARLENNITLYSKFYKRD